MDKAFPDFLLPSIDGGFGRLSDYRGKKLLLFHFASW
jgi:peroxiredoxin